ncbi:MAPEG family protein [Sandarakinorhabdus glacialis]|uniref:MAPEG family protein n=1 Tax=Sandarakinorhabdus glacialis TaxID=1614636 RepID=UPI00166F55A8|nr:MAPEG family protein [Polymorphobacter glacialis]
MTGGLCGLIYFYLSWRVVRVRQSAQVLLGDGGDGLLLQRIRAHANFAEYVPICLILILAIEMSTERSTWLLWTTGLALVVVRLLHAVGMTRTVANRYRVVGAAGTWVVMIGLSVGALVVAVGMGG